MRLLLCDRGDPAAAWLEHGLAVRGKSVQHVAGHDLVAGARWEHRVGDDGVRTRVLLADGRVLDGDGVTAVLNRLSGPPAAALGRVREQERDYALGELHALWSSWLISLPGVLGRPVDGMLCGPVARRAAWSLRAAEAGLAVAPWRAAADVARGVAVAPPEQGPGRPVGTIIVIAQRVVGPRVSGEIVEGCRSLAAALGADVLGIEFDRALRVHSVTPVPDLRAGGAAVLDVLSELLA